MNKKLDEAPKYQINAEGVVSNIEKGNAVSPNKDNRVGLYNAEGRRVFLLVTNLVEKYFPESAKTEAKKVVKKAEKISEVKGKVSAAVLIRAAYDKDPKNFDVRKYSVESGVSYGRVYGCIKKHKEGKK